MAYADVPTGLELSPLLAACLAHREEAAFLIVGADLLAELRPDFIFAGAEELSKSHG